MNTKKKLEDEIDFKDLLKNPIRLFGWIFPLFVLVLLGVGIYYVKNLSLISLNEQPVSATDTTNVKKEIVAKIGGITPAMDLAVIKTPTKDFVAKGKELYNSNCKSCHGDNGMGDGSAGAMLNPKPRNFHAVDGWTNGRTIDQMYKTLQEGIIKNGMAAYEYLAAGDRMAIISYIRTFVEFPPIKDEEIAALDQTYQLTKGTVVPNTVPVAKAETKLIDENANILKKISVAKQIIGVTKENVGAELVKKTATNLDKVFGSFINGLQNQNIDAFASLVVANPTEFGFKPTISRYSKDELAQIYNYLKTVTM